MIKRNYNLFKNLSQFIAAIFFIGLIVIVILIDNYKTPSWLVLISILVAILYWLGTGFIKVEQEPLPIYNKKKMKTIYIVFTLVLFIIWTFFFVLSINYFRFYSSKISDIMTLVTVMITLTTEFTTYLFNKILLHILSK